MPVGAYAVRAFVGPFHGQDPVAIAATIRGNDEVLRRQFNAHDADPTLHAGYEVQSLAVTGSLTITYGNTLVLVNTTGGSVTVTLPPAASWAGQVIVLKKLIAANTLTVDADGSETIDGAATLAWTTQYQSFTLISDGTNVHII